jgi:hypothetical protein
MPRSDANRNEPRGPHPADLPVRWSRLGVFNYIFAGLAGRAGKPNCVMIGSTHLKAHRLAESQATGPGKPLPTPQLCWDLSVVSRSVPRPLQLHPS